MPLILNALDKEQVVVIFGKHFTFKPRQIKDFQENLARFLTQNRREMGFVDVPDEMSDPEFKNSEIGKKILEDKIKEGVEAYCARLRQLIYNEQVSLKNDLDKANLKVDPRVFMDPKMVENMEELVKYQSKKDDADQKRIDHVRALEEKLKQTSK